jgi:hypothetical protein
MGSPEVCALCTCCLTPTFCRPKVLRPSKTVKAYPNRISDRPIPFAALPAIILR